MENLAPERLWFEIWSRRKISNEDLLVNANCVLVGTIVVRMSVEQNWRVNSVKRQTVRVLVKCGIIFWPEFWFFECEEIGCSSTSVVSVALRVPSQALSKLTFHLCVVLDGPVHSFEV